MGNNLGVILMSGWFVFILVLLYLCGRIIFFLWEARVIVILNLLRARFCQLENFTFQQYVSALNKMTKRARNIGGNIIDFAVLIEMISCDGLIEE